MTAILTEPDVMPDLDLPPLCEVEWEGKPCGRDAAYLMREQCGTCAARYREFVCTHCAVSPLYCDRPDRGSLIDRHLESLGGAR